MFLKLDHLSKVFPGRDGRASLRAVDDVTLEIHQGEFITLLGPSGCGKTTTLRLIAGFEFPTEGEIILEGEKINEMPPNKRDMAMVFQSYAIFPHYNVFENIAYGLKIMRLSKQEVRRRVSEALDMTELTGLENRAPNQLSGGQQQRVALARALVMEPKLLLFDEPLSNLDAKLRVQMRTEIRRIQQSLGITTIYVTHDQDEAMALSDRIVVMYNGRIQQVDNALEIYRRPANKFVADFIGLANFLPVKIIGDEGGMLQVKLYETGLAIPKSSRHQFAVGDDAVLLLRPESLKVTLSPAADQVAIPATVGHMSYLGSMVEFQLTLKDQIIAVQQFDPQAHDLHPVGTQVFLTLPQQNLYLLPDA